MITVEIGMDRRKLDDATESWINEQINKRRADKQPVCVRVMIEDGSINIVLSTPGCRGLGGGGRPPSARENEIFNLWDKRGMNSTDFHGGNLIAFLKQLRHQT